MTETDKFVETQLIPFREKVLEGFQQKHPHVYNMINTFLASKKNHIGLKIVDHGNVIGEYTFHLEGLRVSIVDYGALDSEIHHPFLGIVKPYIIIEKSTLHTAIHDEGFINDLAATIPKYLPSFTIKFLA